MGITVYLWLGIGHILLGFDHLLFVFALVVLVRDRRVLCKAITAFTIGHSLSLALTTLGPMKVSVAGLEAAIALSIVFLASEIVQARRSKHFLTADNPWVVCGAFGLLHGLGFAGALNAVHVPLVEMPMALLGFNLGVEIGQLAFIGAILLSWGCWRRVELPWPEWAAPVPAYAIGSVASVWFVGRFLAIL